MVLYKVCWFKKIFIETESEVQEKVASKRMNIVPIKNCVSASELSDDDFSEKKESKKSNEDLVRVKLECLKRKQMV
jgi:hypothetical protein